MHDNRFSSSFDLWTYYWDKFSFCKKIIYGCVSLMVIYGPQKFQMAPENVKRAKHGPQNF